MKFSLFIFLCFCLLGSAHALYGQAQSLVAFADSITYQQEHKHEKKDALLNKQPDLKETLHFQLDTDANGQPLLLIYLKDTVGLLTISAHNPTGASQEVICKHELGKGFYEFVLPKAPAESLKYWQVSMDGQRVISFIK